LAPINARGTPENTCRSKFRRSSDTLIADHVCSSFACIGGKTCSDHNASDQEVLRLTNIDENDTYLHRLGKLTPIYIIALMTAMEGLMAPFATLDVTFQVVGVVMVLIAAIVLFWHFEVRDQKVDLRPQLVIAFVTSMLYITLSSIRILSIDLGDLNYIVLLGVGLWTFVTPMIIKG
jgi:hypothetical protein